MKKKKKEKNHITRDIFNRSAILTTKVLIGIRFRFGVIHHAQNPMTREKSNDIFCA